jgi:SWI/SNF-related matrix-associated actin-dependent regulator of chromatin subfamily A-like protein 1
MLRPSQITGSQFLQDHNNRAIEADIAGLGKTYTILDAIITKHFYPVLIICNKPGLYVWQSELKIWFNGKPSVVYSGSPEQCSKRLQDFITNTEVDFLITNYAFLDEVITKLGPFFFKTLVLDEYHLPGLLNHKTDIYKMVKEISKLIPHVIMSTGTPMRQTPADWFAPLSIIDRKTFSSYWKFVSDWCITTNNGYGQKIERVPQNTDKFLEMLANYRIRCTDKSGLPPKIRQPIPIEMTPLQQQLYNKLQKEMFIEHDGTFLITPNKMTKILRCRQLLVNPMILGFKDQGGGMEILTSLTEEELSEGNPVAIYTPFLDVIPLIEKELSRRIKDLKIFIVHGGMTSDKLAEVQSGFQNPSNKNKVIICTIKSAAAPTFTEASVCIFIGYELGIDNTQAEDRHHRIGQKDTVRCLYLLYNNSVDEWGINLLNDKTKALAMDVSPEQYYQKLIDTQP